jgi:hypothetical protein
VSDDRYPTVLEAQGESMKKLFDQLSDPKREPFYLKELSWCLLNICCFPNNEANLKFDQEWNIVDNTARCI